MNSDNARYLSLDGWRGLSIAFVLAAHLLPLGPKAWRLNESAGLLGMALFFCLSGFLIAKYFLESSSVRTFFVRRSARILPLAWLGLIAAYFLYDLSPESFFYNFLFVANWPPMHLEKSMSHYWSLNVELQYYVFAGLAFWLLRAKYVYLILLACVAVTLLRVMNGVAYAINTYYRVDEILAGSLLFLALHGRYAETAKKALGSVSPLLPLILLLLSTHEWGGWLQYLRPYFAAWLVGSTLSHEQGFWKFLLNSRVLSYLAVISYALYVIHPFLLKTWLGEGDVVEKYLKRPLFFAVLFVLAHLSTFYYEKYFTDLSRRVSKRWSTT